MTIKSAADKLIEKAANNGQRPYTRLQSGKPVRVRGHGNQTGPQFVAADALEARVAESDNEIVTHIYKQTAGALRRGDYAAVAEWLAYLPDDWRSDVIETFSPGLTKKVISQVKNMIISSADESQSTIKEWSKVLDDVKTAARTAVDNHPQSLRDLVRLGAKVNSIRETVRRNRATIAGK